MGNPKYMVFISESYFTERYGNQWLEMIPSMKKKLREEVTNEIDDHLGGIKKANSQLIDKAGNWVLGIEVEEIK